MYQSGLVASELDSKSKGCEFESCPIHMHLGQQ